MPPWLKYWTGDRFRFIVEVWILENQVSSQKPDWEAVGNISYSLKARNRKITDQVGPGNSCQSPGRGWSSTGITLLKGIYSIKRDVALWSFSGSCLEEEKGISCWFQDTLHEGRQMWLHASAQWNDCICKVDQHSHWHHCCSGKCRH